jgi:hypothetical protein
MVLSYNFGSQKNISCLWSSEKAFGVHPYQRVVQEDSQKRVIYGSLVFIFCILLNYISILTPL